MRERVSEQTVQTQNLLLNYGVRGEREEALDSVGLDIVNCKHWEEMNLHDKLRVIITWQLVYKIIYINLYNLRNIGLITHYIIFHLISYLLMMVLH